MKNLDNVASIIGGNGQTRPHEFYPTPRECTEALIQFLNIPKGETIWECAVGGGNMEKVFAEYGYKVIGTDIQTGTDFITAPFRECDWIITKPPFSLAEQFIRRANESGKPFAFLLKSQYWHSAKRLKLFKEIPPSYILPLTWRPDFTGRGNSLMDAIWCVWNGEKGTRYIPLQRPKGEDNGSKH